MRSLRLRRARSLVTGVAVLGAVAAAPATASAGVLDSLAGWWPMYEGSGQVVHDLSGRGDHGTLGSTPGIDENDPTWIRGFLFGSALRFDGNDFVRIADAPALRPQQLTVSAWVRASASPGAYRHILGKGASGCLAASYGLFSSYNGGLRFYTLSTDGQDHQSGLLDPAYIWDGKWHHVAGTWDGRDARLFLDGKLVPTSAGTPGTIDYNVPTTGDSGIGGYLGTCDLYYTGDIDQVALFSQALPVDRIWSSIAAVFSRPRR
jgi:concanavalin A-like lectin/glucanase superfamily protein